MAKPGTTTLEIDRAVEALFARYGAQPLFKGYPGARVPFPAVTCISVNEQVVHGIPGPRQIREGDLVKFDTACKLNGWCADAAISIEPIAVDLLAARLRTPLQIEQYLARAFEETFRVGEKLVTAAVVEAVLSRQIDDLEPRLTRYGYDVKSIAEEFRIKPADVRLFLQGQLDPARTRELTEQMLVAGLPV